MTPGGERRRLARTKVRPAGERRGAASESLWPGRGARNKWPPRPSPGGTSRGRVPRAPGRGGRWPRGARPPVRLSAHRRGIGAGEWGPGGGGAASLGAAPGRGLSAALRPPAAAIAASESSSGSGGGCFPPPSHPPNPVPHPEPLGVPRGDRAPPPLGVQGPLPAGPRPRGGVGDAPLTVPAHGLSSGGARRRCAPADGVSRETAGMTAAGWARTMANSTAVRVSGPPVRTLPDRAPPPLQPPFLFPSPPGLGRKVKVLARRGGAPPVWHPVPAGTFPCGTECPGGPPRGCFPHQGRGWGWGGEEGVSSFKQLPRLVFWDGSSCPVVLGVSPFACASTFPTLGVWDLGCSFGRWCRTFSFQRNNQVKTFSGLLCSGPALQ